MATALGGGVCLVHTAVTWRGLLFSGRTEHRAGQGLTKWLEKKDRITSLSTQWHPSTPPAELVGLPPGCVL